MSSRISGLFLVLTVVAALAIPAVAAEKTPAVEKAPAAAKAAAAEKAPAARTEGKKPVVELVTSKGTITVELWPDAAPQTVKNFVDYVVEGHYNGTIFHRVMKDFVIQGGGFAADMKEKQTRAPIPLEAKEPNRKYTLSMARTPDPNSATSQFYINLKDNTNLDPNDHPPGYAVFGKVIKGQGVVDQIAVLPTENKGGAFTNLTNPVVVIEKATIVK